MYLSPTLFQKKKFALGAITPPAGYDDVSSFSLETDKNT